MGNVGKLWVKLMSTVSTNLTLDVYIPGGGGLYRVDFVFINQLNFRPTSIGKHNSMGHLLPCAIDFKTNHPPIHLQVFTLSHAIQLVDDVALVETKFCTSC